MRDTLNLITTAGTAITVTQPMDEIPNILVALVTVILQIINLFKKPKKEK